MSTLLEFITVPVGTIFLAYRGSAAQNLYIPGKSDIDLGGIVIPPSRFYLGLDTWGHNGTGTMSFKETPYETTYFELRKFVRMLINANPNALPLIFGSIAPVLIAPAGQMLIAQRQLFLTRKIAAAFVGCSAHDMREAEAREYDPVTFAHVIRQLRMAYEAIRYGTLDVYRHHDREELLAIKAGEFQPAELKAMATDLIQKIHGKTPVSCLPPAPDRAAIDQLLVEILELTLYRKDDTLPV